MDIFISEAPDDTVRPYDRELGDQVQTSLDAAVRLAERRSITRGRQRVTTRAVEQVPTGRLRWVIQDVEARKVEAKIEAAGTDLPRDASL